MKAKLLIITILSISFLMPGMAQNKKERTKKSKKNKTEALADTAFLKTRIDSVSYGLGILFGSNLKRGGIDSLNSQLLTRGFDEALKDQKTRITPDVANALLNQYAMELNKAKGQKNLAAGQAFLEKNKADSGVVVLPSGLQYKIIKAGTGEKPTLNNKVTVHYHGTLIDGTVFDSSIQRGEPIELTVGGVIEGWKEALQLMPVGSKWKLFVPSNLGYGETGAQGSPIGPNSALIFDVELISINKE
jgi:FKBP-type peptidyl-prolyl cis-trans isomerase FklB